MPVTKPTYYATLGVPETADDVTIEHAYKARIGAAHPDRAAGEGDRQNRTRMAAAINEAGHVLRDPARRAVYDFDLAAVRRAELARRMIVPRPTVRSTYPPPAAPMTAPAADSVYEQADDTWGPSPDFGAPPERGSWQDLRARWRATGARASFLAFLRFNLVGQWLVVGVVWIVTGWAQASFWPTRANDLPLHLAALGVWLLVGAFLAHSWMRHPLGQLLHLGGYLVDSFFGALGDDRDQKEV